MYSEGLLPGGSAGPNRPLVLERLRRAGPLTRRELSARSGLSITTTKRMVEELLREGLLMEAASSGPGGAAGPHRRGRRAAAVCLNPAAACAVGLNLEPGRVEASVVDLTGAEHYHHAVPIAGQGRKQIEELLLEEARLARRAAGGEAGRLLGVGVGVAGVIDARDGVVRYCPNLQGWENVPLADVLRERLGTEVLVDDGVRCIALAEKRYGASREEPDSLYIFVGSGVGAGIILGERFYRGRNGLSGEFGHITVRQNGPLCNCGNHGCLEALVSREAILRSVLAMIGSNVYSSLRELSGRRELTLGDIQEAAEAGDKLANMVIHEAGDTIGTGVADLVNIFDPGLVILGGEVVACFGAMLIDGIARTVQLRGLHSITQRTRIASGRFRDGVAARGAATMMIERFLQSDILAL